VKVLFTKINLELITDTTISQNVPVTHINCSCVESILYQAMMTTLFAHFQQTDSILSKPFGPLSTAAPSCFDHRGCQQGWNGQYTGRGKELYANLQAWGIQTFHSQRVGADRKTGW